MQLIIGNKNFSSWSLRPWILMQHARIPFEEIEVEEYCRNTDPLPARISPTKKIPALKDGPLELWDSLAICEYIADRFPQRQLWPESQAMRARARALSSEMHAGFEALRMALPMDLAAPCFSGQLPLEAEIDVNRVVQLLEQSLDHSEGPWLFGKYSVADAMYTPMMLRFRHHDIYLPELSRAYCDQVLDDAPMKRWIDEVARRLQREAAPA